MGVDEQEAVAETGHNIILANLKILLLVSSSLLLPQVTDAICPMANGKKQVVSKALRALETFLPQLSAPSLNNKAGNLYQILSRYPHDGVGIQVSQTRWGQKGIANSYWLVTRTRLKLEGKHGKAWGKLYWKGMFLRLMLAVFFVLLHRISSSGCFLNPGIPLTNCGISRNTDIRT
jgi:small subunit ribosomal protein S34